MSGSLPNFKRKQKHRLSGEAVRLLGSPVPETVKLGGLHDALARALGMFVYDGTSDPIVLRLDDSASVDANLLKELSLHGELAAHPAKHPWMAELCRSVKVRTGLPLSEVLARVLIALKTKAPSDRAEFSKYIQALYVLQDHLQFPRPPRSDGLPPDTHDAAPTADSVNAKKQRHGKKKGAGDYTPKQIEMIGKATIVADAIYAEVMDDTGKTLGNILTKAGVSRDTFSCSGHFESARSRWTTLRDQRKDAAHYRQTKTDNFPD